MALSGRKNWNSLVVIIFLLFFLQRRPDPSLEIQTQFVVIFSDPWSWLPSLLLLISGVVKLCQETSAVEMFGLQNWMS